MTPLIESARKIFTSIFTFGSIWSITALASVWLIIAVIVMISMDSENSERASSNLKTNLSFFLLFLATVCGLAYFFFNYIAK